MASRKPSISRATKKPAARKPRGVTVIPDALATRIDQLERSAAVLAEQQVKFDAQIVDRIQGLEERQPPALVLDGLVADQLKNAVASIRGIEEAMAKVAERMGELLAREPAPAKERKPREPKNGAAAPAEGVVIKTGTADQGTPVAEDPPPVKEKVDRKTCTHAKTEPVPGNAKLIRCLSCNATLDAPAPAAPETKPLTFEELREKAVAFAQKRSKQAMLETLAPFAGLKKEEWEKVKLSLVPDAKRAEAMKALEVA